MSPPIGLAALLLIDPQSDRDWWVLLFGVSAGLALIGALVLRPRLSVIATGLALNPLFCFLTLVFYVAAFGVAA